MNLISAILDRLLPKRVIIDCDRLPYLHRWYLFRSSRITIFIHRFVRSDEDRALHDHPWPFLVVPLWRGYREHNEGGVRRVYPLIGARYRSAEYRHRVELLVRDRGEDYAHVTGNPRFVPLPAWSLFFHFTKCRDWGFWLPEGFKLWNKFWQEKCE